jgi:DNA-directed RNA polymerase specialized sigma24 family protein
MTSEGSITRWLERLHQGDPAAAQPLWDRYFARLVGLARAKLRNTPRRAADEEDVALSAFDSFCRNAAAGRFPRLSDRDDLWQVLVLLTVRKAAHLIRDQNCDKRGGGQTILTPVSTDEEDSLLDKVLGREPSPELAAELDEQYQSLLKRLDNRVLEQVAVLRMEGYSVDEIAAKLDYAPRSIKRKLHAIRLLWESEPGELPSG